LLVVYQIINQLLAERSFSKNNESNSKTQQLLDSAQLLAGDVLQLTGDVLKDRKRIQAS